MNSVNPFPSLLDQQVSVLEGTPKGGDSSRRAKKHRTIYVPLGDNPVDFFLRSREMARLEWGGALGASYIHDIARNYRLGRLMQMAGVEVQDTPPFLMDHMAITDIRSAAKAYFEQVGFAEEEHTTLGLYHPQLAEIEQTVDGLDWRDPNSAQVLANHLQNLFPDTPSHHEYGGDGDARDRYWKYMAQKKLTQTQKDILATLGGAGAYYASLNEKNIWCPMVVKTPPLIQRLRSLLSPGHRMNPRTRLTGLRVRRPSRLLQDGRAFLKAQRGGSLLIDNSGSMSIPQYQLVEFLAQNPASTIASYNSNGQVGALCILAKNGKLSKQIHSSGSGNGVDGPALDWLSRQTKPRLWVSDGAVTGMGDVCGANLALECAAIMIRHQISRVNDLGDAARWFSRKR